MSLEKVKKFFESKGLENAVMEFDVSSATVVLAAKALGCEEARIAKTLSFRIDEQPVLIVTAGDVKIDNSKYKKLFHTKAKMLKFERSNLLSVTGSEGFALLLLMTG